MRRIYPPDPSAMYTNLRDAYAQPPETNQPWVVLSMVHSIDGSTSLAGVSGPLGSEADQAVFSTLRSRADVILVGAATVRTERYQPLKRVGQRLAIVTASGDLPWQEPVYTHAQTVIVAPIDAPAMPVEALRVGAGRVDLQEAVRRLQPRVVLLEGGSSLNGQMLAAGLVDEICVTVAPLTVAGSGPRLAASPQETLTSFRLEHILEQDGFLFSRYFALRGAV